MDRIILQAPGGEIIANRAATPLSRLRGLLARRPLQAGEALWLVPCRSVHTMGMHYALDVAWLDRDGSVLSVTEGLRPRRHARGQRGTHSALEMAAGESRRLGLAPGARLQADHPGAHPGGH